jgi:hypothetical protein
MRFPLPCGRVRGVPVEEALGLSKVLDKRQAGRRGA